jgi:tetratricopeptide (TPR) repeat protein
VGDRRGLAYTLSMVGFALRAGIYDEAVPPDTYARGTALGEEALTLARAEGVPWLVRHALHLLSSSADMGRAGERDRAVEAATEMAALSAQAGDTYRLAMAQRALGRAALCEHDYPHARAAFTGELAAARAYGDRAATAFVLRSLGDVARAQGELAEASALYEESCALYRDLDVDQEFLAHVLLARGDIARAQGDARHAALYYRESLAAAGAANAPARLAQALEALGGLAAAGGRPARARQLTGAAAALREQTGHRLTEAERAALAQAMAAAWQAREPKMQAESWGGGRAITLAQIISELLAEEPSA